MKKSFAISIILALSVNAVLSQAPSGFNAHPCHVVGNVIDSSGEVIDQLTADFQYKSDGTLQYFDSPLYNYHSQYHFSNQLPISIYATYSFDEYGEQYRSTKEFTYDNGLLQMEFIELMEYTFDNRDYHYIFYTYDEDRNLRMKEDSTFIGDRVRWLYEYENDGKTKIVTYYRKVYGNYYQIWDVYTYQYDDNHLLQEVVTEKRENPYQSSETTKQTYFYTENGKLSSEISQKLVDSVWVNTKIHNNIYDENGDISEQQDGVWSEELGNWEITNKAIHEFSLSDLTYTVSFYKKSDDSWTRDTYKGQKLFFEPELHWQENEMIIFSRNVNQLVFSMDISSILNESEWYYEIQNDDGSITYQHLEYAADTTIGSQRPKIIVRSNTHYDRDTLFTETTHEYVYEENGKVYWWNKDLQEFTTLYDLAANEGDEWEIKVGTESITVHVDSVGVFGYDGETRKMLHVSDSGDFFSGDIVVGYGHLTSFFPEKLMRHNADFTVNGLRCYWVGDALLYHNGEEDCDAIYSEIHGIEEDGPSTGSEAFTVYPNPTNNVLFVQTLRATSLPAQYRITNLIGQNMLTGNISDGTQLIDIESLPAGMYFISVGEQTVKFVKQ